MLVWLSGSLISAWYCHYEDYLGENDNAVAAVLFCTIAWPIAVLIFGVYHIVIFFGLGVMAVFRTIFIAVDEIAWLATRKLVDQNDNGKLYKGWHARWCTKEYDSTRTYAVLHVQDSTGKYKIPVDPKQDTVDGALAWSYRVDSYDNVVRA